MSGQRSLLRSISAASAGKRHACRANSKHVLFKNDPILVVKIDRDNFHYCTDCARKFIATAREKLDSLEADLLQAPPAETRARD
jgi:hypothetical protein